MPFAALLFLLAVALLVADLVFTVDLCAALITFITVHESESLSDSPTKSFDSLVCVNDTLDTEEDDGGGSGGGGSVES